MTSNYLTGVQQDVLLQAIRPARVGRTPRGMSHVEAYEIRAHLNRVFGFARWSADVIDQQLIYETCEQRTKQDSTVEYTAWSIAYRTILRLTVCAKDGTVLATYTEGATGDATNQPSRADAHDNALKTSESQALKRCAANLGDQFGLGLYKKGSMAALVGQLLPDVWPEGGQQDVAAHVTETPPEVDGTPAEAPEYETNAEPQLPAPPEVSDAVIAPFVQALLAGPDPDMAPNLFYARAQAQAAKRGWLQVLVPNRDNTRVSIKALIDSELIENKRSKASA